MDSQVSFLIFDVEAIADGDLIQRVRYPKLELSPDEAVAKYRAELIAERGDGKDFIPYTFMLPISIAIAKIDRNYRLLDLSLLDSPNYRPHVIARKFWQGWEHYKCPTFVTFNGRGYDLPLMELTAYRFGYSLPKWFNVDEKSFAQSRNRYNMEAHLDLMDLITNYGASRPVGGLNLLANLIGKPGKTGIDGSMVQDLYNAGKVQEINDYCRYDVLDTYFVFLRTRVLLGKMTLQREHELVEETRAWLQSQADDKAYEHYLSHWGTWLPPGD